MKSIFDTVTRDTFLQRVDQLDTHSKPQWGEMNVCEMMAHCSLAFEYNNGQREAKVNPILRFLLKPMMRKVILGEEPYKKNSPTASYFKVFNTETLELEKQRLKQNIINFSNGGAVAAMSRRHVWLGTLTGEEWSWLMYKHLDHHLTQFGV
ncbi:MAG: hypothetical protein Salg2KO_18760 [Salibacteraceae bacterium]